MDVNSNDYVANTNSAVYPTKGRSSDGYWYVNKKAICTLYSGNV